MSLRKKNTGMTLADLFALFFVLILISSAYIIFWQRSAELQPDIIVAKIMTKQKLHSSHELNQNKLLTIHGEMGISIIEIKQHKIRFKKSPCRSKYCILAGWRSNTNDFIACLPNRVSIELVGGTAKFDAINF